MSRKHDEAVAFLKEKGLEESHAVTVLRIARGLKDKPQMKLPASNPRTNHVDFLRRVREIIEKREGCALDTRVGTADDTMLNDFLDLWRDTSPNK